MTVSREDAVELYEILKDGKWRKQSDIPLPGPKVREICNEFAPWFISNTQQGYRITKAASDQEIEHSIADLRSRIAKMTKRADALAKYLRDKGQQDAFQEEKEQTAREKARRAAGASPPRCADCGCKGKVGIDLLPYHEGPGVNVWLCGSCKEARAAKIGEANAET